MSIIIIIIIILLHLPDQCELHQTASNSNQPIANRGSNSQL